VQPALPKATSLLFGAFAFAVIVRVSIPNNVLNVFEHYSNAYDGSGNILEKIHPGAWMIFALIIFMFPRVLARWRHDDGWIISSMFIMSIAILVDIMICVFTGQTASIGYLIDSLFAACAAVCVALCFSASQRYLLGNVLLIIVILSSIVGIMEFVANTRFLPKDWGGFMLSDLSVRGQGLFSHPLMLGLCDAVAIPVVYLTNWTRLAKVAASLILLAGIFAAGARAAAVASILMAILGLIYTSGKGLDVHARILNATLVTVGVLVSAAIILFIASSLGLTERFEKEGLIDDSTMTRVIIFQIFGYMDWSELLLGVGNFEMLKLTWIGLNIQEVENSLIAYVFQFGIIGACCLVAALLNALFTLGRRAPLPLKMALVTFLVVAFANNTMSSKSTALLLIFMLAMAFRDTTVERGRTTANARTRPQRFAAMPAHVRLLSNG